MFFPSNLLLGKTSTKNLLTQAISLYKQVSSTPKSYNTPLGIARHLNSINADMFDYLVLEFGTSSPGDIKRIKSLVPPNIAFITDIGYMHIENFKTKEKLIKEKLSILDGTYKAIVNYDVEWIRDNIDYNGLLITYGFSHGDYIAKNIHDGYFDVLYKGELIGTFKSELVGKHQILNLLGVIAFIHSEGFDLNVLRRGIPLFKGVPNRIEKKRINNITILDDSYNSNPKGFIEALSILKDLPRPRYLITPGIVELGKYKKEVYNMLIPYIIDSVDSVVLVGKFNTMYLYKHLKSYNININQISSFKEAYNLFKQESSNYDECSLLIENDLPDIYRIGIN